MITRGFIHPVRLARAFIIVALCGIVAASAWGDRGGGRSSDRGSRGGGISRQSGGPGGPGAPSTPSGGRDARVDRPRGDNGSRSGGSGGWTRSGGRDTRPPTSGNDRQRVDNRKSDNPSPGQAPGQTPSQKPGSQGTQVGNDRGRGDRYDNGRFGGTNQGSGARQPGDSRGKSDSRYGRDRGQSGNGGSQVGNRTDNRSNGQRNRDREVKPWQGNRTEHYRGSQDRTNGPRAWTRNRDNSKPRVQINRGTRVHIDINYRPRWYTPPTFSVGRYHYAARPHFRPAHYGFWCFNYDPGFCRRSIYFHFGYFPYVQVTRVWIAPYVVVGYYSGPVVFDDGGYYLAKSASAAALDDALADIRKAWVEARLDLLQNHVEEDWSIAVLLDGKYDYSLEPDDYVEMTSDAMEQMKTSSFTWTTVRKRTDGQYTAFGKHIYLDESGAEKTVYVSYTLKCEGGAYWVTEVGSGASPLN